MDQVNIELIGTGNFTHEVYFPVPSERDDVNLAAICDVNQERLDRTFKQYRIGEKFSDYKEMIKKNPSGCCVHHNSSTADSKYSWDKIRGDREPGPSSQR